MIGIGGHLPMIEKRLRTARAGGVLRCCERHNAVRERTVWRSHGCFKKHKPPVLIIFGFPAISSPRKSITVRPAPWNSLCSGPSRLEGD